jgi:uncharacterized protein YndB with AHSA1/START domain
MNATAFDPGPLAAVSYAADGDRWTLVFLKALDHPPERVWEALTDPAQLERWAPFTSDRDLAETGPATLTMIDSDQSVDLEARVTRAEPPSLLEYSWGDDNLRWELEPHGDGTRLTLRHTVEGEDWLPKVAAGWHLCLLVAERMLGGVPVEPIRGQEAMDFGWQELHDQYAEKLDID